MTVADTLRAARALIEDPDHWTTGNLAVNDAGREVSPDNPTACRWCAVGALLHTTTDRVVGGKALETLNAAADGQAAVVNDHRGHAAVLAMYDRAIELAEATK